MLFRSKAGDKPVRVKVNSFGGDVNEALAISRLFEERGNVTVEFCGFNASAATWMAFGAAHIEIREDSFWLAHKSLVFLDIYGTMNADQIEDKIKELQSEKKSNDAIDLMIASKYANRSGKSIKEVFELMSEEKWISAAEALEWGFVDKVIPAKNKNVITNQLIDNIIAAGLPRPVANESPEEDEKPMTLSAFKSFFNGLMRKDNSKTEVIIMNKTFTFVNSILKEEGVKENNGTISLTVDQLKLINDALEQSSKDKEQSDRQIKDITDKIDALSPTLKDKTDISDKIGMVKDIIDKIPAENVVTSSGNNDGKTDFSDIAVDPVNSFMEA